MKNLILSLIILAYFAFQLLIGHIYSMKCVFHKYVCISTFQLYHAFLMYSILYLFNFFENMPNILPNRRAEFKKF
jgi:hypothetical protein